MAAAIEINPSSERVLNGVGMVSAPNSLVLASVLTSSVSYVDSAKLVKGGEIQVPALDDPRVYSPANSVLPFHLLDHSYFSLNGFLEKISDNKANKGRKRKLSVEPSSADGGSAAKKPTQVPGGGRGARKVSLSREQSEDEDKLLSLLQAAESTDRKGSFSSSATGSGKKNSPAAAGKGSGKKRNKSQKENESKSPTSAAGGGSGSSGSARKRENSKMSDKDLDSTTTTTKQKASKSEKQQQNAASSGSAGASGDKGRKLTVKLFGKAASAATTTTAGKGAAKSAKSTGSAAKGSSALAGRKAKSAPAISQSSSAASQSRNTRSPRKR